MQLVSIIIPYYKNYKEIGRALNSALGQNISEFEIIIINDASPDWEEGLAIINSYEDSRIKVISHEHNKNGAAARNTGIKRANGDFIAFLDADDEWASDHLSTSLEFLTCNDWDLVFSKCLFYGKTGSRIMPEKGIDDNQTLSDYLFVEGGVIATPSIVVKAKLAKQILFNESLRRHQDYDFLLKSEAVGIIICFKPKQSVIVHWENNNIREKGGTWDFSLMFASQYKKYFSVKAYSLFVFKFVILASLEEKERLRGVRQFFTLINPFHLSALNYYFFISYLIFGKFKHPYRK
jgi:amylovoran biosynthesis glycosyltransferase AmsB